MVHARGVLRHGAPFRTHAMTRTRPGKSPTCVYTASRPGQTTARSVTAGTRLYRELRPLRLVFGGVHVHGTATLLQAQRRTRALSGRGAALQHTYAPRRLQTL